MNIREQDSLDHGRQPRRTSAGRWLGEAPGTREPSGYIARRCAGGLEIRRPAG